MLLRLFIRFYTDEKIDINPVNQHTLQLLHLYSEIVPNNKA